MSNIFYDISGDDPTGNKGNGWSETCYGTSYTSAPDSSSQTYDGWWILWQRKMVEWATACTNTQLGTITGGAGYTDGNYTDVMLISEQQFNDPTLQGGLGLKVNLTVTGGIVTQATIVDGGMGYQTDEFVVLADGDMTIGAGDGFKIQIASADSSVCIPRVFTDAYRFSNSASYNVGIMILFDREDAGFKTGYFIYYQGSLAAKPYFRCVSDYNPQSNDDSTVNNGYGSYTNGFASYYGYVYINNEWGDGNADENARFYFSYDTTPGSRYFAMTNDSPTQSYDMNNYTFLIGDLITPTGPDYPSAQTMPKWFARYWATSSASYNGSIDRVYTMGVTASTTAITDLLNVECPYSRNTGNMLTGMPVMSDAFFLGYTTPNLGFTTNFSINDQYVQADGTVWTKRGNTLWIKGSYEYRGNAAPGTPYNP